MPSEVSLQPNVKVDDNRTINTLKTLVGINSVNAKLSGGPGEEEIANQIARLLDSSCIEVRSQKISSGWYNVIGILRGEGGGRSLMFKGHMDTVGVAGMEISPFEPAVKDGMLYGRDSCDMKGGLSGMISAMTSLAQSKIRLKGDVYLSAVVDEEYKSLGTENVVEQYKTDAAIVGEPTGMHVAIAHMGYVWMEVEARGRTAHGSVPEKGHDAIADMAFIIQEIEKLKVDYKSQKRIHPLLGIPKLHTSTITRG